MANQESKSFHVSSSSTTLPSEGSIFSANLPLSVLYGLVGSARSLIAATGDN